MPLTTISAAMIDTGSGASQVPTNGDLGTAATKDHGTASGEIPLNSDIDQTYVEAASGRTTAKSTEQALPSAGASVTFAHGLGARPTKYWVEKVCKITENNYAVDQSYEPDGIGVDGANEFGFEVTADATNVIVTRGANATVMMDKSTGQQASFTDINWRLVLHAELQS